MKYTLGAIIDKTRNEKRGYTSVSTIPMSVMTDISMLPRLNQLAQGACVGHAGANAINYDYFKKIGLIPDSSARWNYATAKIIDGDTNEGTSALSMYKAWKMFGGSATETSIPNDASLSVDKYTTIHITPEMLSDAAKYPVINETEISNPTCGQLQSLISQYGVVLIALTVDEESWMREEGKVNLLPGNAGGHEILLYGYEQDGNDVRFHILNSWGDTWGKKGCGSFLYNDYIGNIYDAMTIQIDMIVSPIISFTKDKFMSFYKGTSAAPTAETCYDAIAIALAESNVLTNATLIGALATVRVEVGRSYLPVREDISQQKANKEYNGRMGNYPNSNDGYIYRGGGFIQLTGRDNYTKYGIASNPNVILEIGVSANVLVKYFIDNNVIQACNAQNWKLVRELVNGGDNGLETFESIITQFEKV